MYSRTVAIFINNLNYNFMITSAQNFNIPMNDYMNNHHARNGWLLELVIIKLLKWSSTINDLILRSTKSP